ncbi:amino acid permease [Oryzihumus leptocrescens]|uniref:Amino acid/polyamine/organocation transporter (APC superfamily) n=1 Tax=Oryzihumus leptocrescens TaxID=297536 RepID=A0A542ZLK6_9MICO|nr:amino acid permease [Oryzihumus leptocrescens]TQL61224.1 amino acid/polyamine/organocation transporter (APC superfamily) [Oryzihumus leptocrescens]
MSATPPASPQPVDADSAMLAELGYEQELHRRMSGFNNFAVSFSIISILAGAITSYGIALNAGGPIAISIGWPLVGLFVWLVALAMGEVCSVFPTAGGLYFWAGRLARHRKPMWAWYVGWFNFLGEVAVTAAIDYGAAITWMAFLDLTWGVGVTAGRTFIAFAVILLLHGLLNTFGVDLVRRLSDISAWWHLAGVAVIVAVLSFVPDHHQSLSWTFTHFENATGWNSVIYVFLIGLLMAQYTFTGFDASAHVAEETHSASVNAPKGIVNSVVVSLFAGWVLLVAITASIQNVDRARTTSIGLPPAQIFIDAAGHSLGVALVFICAVAQFFCGMASVTANSRMSYAFSRDNALPGSRWWSRVNPRTGTPTNSIWLCVVCSLVLASPALFSTTAYLAVTSIAVIGLYIAYVTPVLLRRLNPDFRPGAWNLGRWSPLVGWIAVIWVAFIVILFMLPPANPITVDTFNYAPIAVLAVLVFATITWIIGGRHHFMKDVPPGHDTRPAAEIFGPEVP